MRYGCSKCAKLFADPARADIILFRTDSSGDSRRRLPPRCAATRQVEDGVKGLRMVLRNGWLRSVAPRDSEGGPRVMTCATTATRDGGRE